MSTKLKLYSDALRIFRGAVQAADPTHQINTLVRCVHGKLFLGQDTSTPLELNSFGQVFVAGAGKASAQMAAAVVRIFEQHNTLPISGYVITKHGHLDPTSDDAQTLTANHVQVRTGGHPLPDSDGVLATQEMVSALGALKRKSIGDVDLPPLIVYCISGGGSALTCVPAAGLSLEDIRNSVSELLACGASIDEVNAMRKHITQGVQGGRVPPLVASSGATVLSLVLSDVVGDSLDVISSGPTVQDTTTFQTCSDIMEQYDLENKLPGVVVTCIKQGLANEISSTADKQVFENTRHLLVGSNALALQAAQLSAKQLGYQTLVLTSRLQGEAKHVARMLAAIAKDATEGGVKFSSSQNSSSGEESMSGPCCILVGGETTVTLQQGHGKGGRNQELALAAAVDLVGTDNVLLLSAGTDGQDGPTDAAGAYATGETLGSLETKRRAMQSLRQNDSNSFWKGMDASEGDGGLVMTGPTGTNVMDVVVILVGEKCK